MMARCPVFPVFLMAVLGLLSPGETVQAQSADEAATEPAPAARYSRVNQVIIDAIRASNPQSATQRMRAVNNLANIGELELAAEYLDQAAKLDTPDEEFAAMMDEFGSPFFIRLSLKRQLQPQIDTYTKRVFEAARRVANDPTRLQVHVEQLSSDSLDERKVALNKLRSVGPQGAAAILSALASPDSQDEAKRLQRALVAFGPDSQPALIAGLRSGQDAMPVYALRALQTSQRPGSGEVIPDLLKWCFAPNVEPAMRNRCSASVTRAFGSMPTREATRNYLVHRVQRLLEPDARILPINLDGDSQLWVWHDGQLQRRSYPQSVAHLIRATQLAADLFAIDAETGRSRLLFAATQLGTAKIAGGLPRPLQTDQPSIKFVQSQFSPEELESVLSFCLDHDLIPSAIATIELLAEVGSENNLGYEASRSALARSLRYPNRRVQFAAVEAILAIGPTAAFKGACDLVHVLTRFASSDGRPRVLVVHPVRGEADVIANSLPEFGFEADIATNGTQAIACLLRKSDYDLIVVGDAVSSPKWSELVQQLRHLAPATPITIMFHSYNQSLAVDVATQIDQVEIFPIPYDAESVKGLLKLSLATPSDPLTLAERREYADRSFGHLAKLAQPKYAGLFDVSKAEPVLQSAIHELRISEHTIRAAGLVGTPALQKSLVELASDSNRELKLREAAIEAIDVAVDRRGLLLTHSQLQTQYENYNHAIDVKADDVEVLGKLLDSIERPSGASSILDQ